MYDKNNNNNNNNNNNFKKMQDVFIIKRECFKCSIKKYYANYGNFL